MRRRAGATGALACLLLALAGCEPAPRRLPFDRFESVAVFVPRGEPRDVVLLVSDDAGFDSSIEGAARALRKAGSLVVAVDLARYRHVLTTLPDEEAYPGADLEVLGQYVQRELGLARFRTPILAGVGGGASVAYAALAEQGARTFRGAIGVDFCPRLTLPKRAGEGSALALRPTPGSDTARLLPKPGPPESFVVVATPGHARPCSDAEVAAFVAGLPAGQIVSLGDEARGLDPASRLALAIETGLARLPTASRPAPEGEDVADLPLVTLPPPDDHSDTLVVILSGDGGWAALVTDVGSALQDQGFGVVGVDSLRYFWKPRTPDGASADLARVLRHYLQAWGAQRIALVGYSRGADVLPFLVHRLPADLRKEIALVVLLGPGLGTSFEFHVTDWLGQGRGDTEELPVLPEARQLAGVRVLCVQGEGEEESLCDALPPDLAQVETLPGGHHFDGDYDTLARHVTEALERRAP